MSALSALTIVHDRIKEKIHTHYSENSSSNDNGIFLQNFSSILKHTLYQRDPILGNTILHDYTNYKYHLNNNISQEQVLDKFPTYKLDRSGFRSHRVIVLRWLPIQQ